MLRSIDFQNYKAFKESVSLKIKPITLIVGKNSSGKSSILKLFPMFSNMMSGDLTYPLLLNNDGIISGTAYEDLFYNKENTGLTFTLNYDNDIRLNAVYYVHEGTIHLLSFAMNSDVLAREACEKSVRGMVCYEMFDEHKIDPDDLTLNVSYIGPIRKQSPHNIVFEGLDDNLDVGYDGGGAYRMLLNSMRTDKKLYNSVSEWMEKNLEGQKLEFTNTANNTGNYSLMVKRGSLMVNTSQVGQGLAQVLPIIVKSFAATKNSINVIEQPALHLHPAAHASVAYRLGQSAKENDCSYIIESHSNNILLGFRRMVVDPRYNFTKDDIAIYYVDRAEKEAFVREIKIDENGDLSEWPTDVFGEDFELLREINRMRR